MIDPTAFIAPGAKVVGDVTLGRESSIWYNSVVRGDLAPVHIGDQTNIQDLSVVHVDEGVPCRIGSRVGVGHRAILHGCTVDDDCLIGMGSILLNGVHVGSGSVVGAGALLTEGLDVPPCSVVLGFPARVVRAVDDLLRERIELTWRHYTEQARDHRAGRVTGHASTPIPSL
ncbi:MAG: gamma carbonic anhydrase family protein [Gemmatimonadota bacterium]|nr:MAG: gamma carbonic anhydrase family protein [Gemmatimonadota bacterium]